MQQQPLWDFVQGSLLAPACSHRKFGRFGSSHLFCRNLYQTAERQSTTLQFESGNMIGTRWLRENEPSQIGNNIETRWLREDEPSQLGDARRSISLDLCHLGASGATVQHAPGMWALCASAPCKPQSNTWDWALTARGNWLDLPSVLDVEVEEVNGG